MITITTIRNQTVTVKVGDVIDGTYYDTYGMGLIDGVTVTEIQPATGMSSAKILGTTADGTLHVFTANRNAFRELFTRGN